MIQSWICLTLKSTRFFQCLCLLNSGGSKGGCTPVWIGYAEYMKPCSILTFCFLGMCLPTNLCTSTARLQPSQIPKTDHNQKGWVPTFQTAPFFLGDNDMESYSGLARKINSIKLGAGEHVRKCRRGHIGLEWQNPFGDMKHVA